MVVAPNAFKGTLSAVEAAGTIAKQVRRRWQSANVIELPMSDGGDGFTRTLVRARRGRATYHMVPGPLGEVVRAPIGWVRGPAGRTAVLELATTTGITLVAHPTPLTAGTAGTGGLGVLVRTALDHGAAAVLVGVGGTCSTDAGVGAAKALGYRFCASDRSDIPEGGLGLLMLERIDTSGVDQRIAAAQVLVACDVKSPLLGPKGAARLYGPQKGADPATVLLLEQAMAHLAAVVRRDLGTDDVTKVPGSGAAGGTGFGLMAFCGARIVAGAALVAETVGLDTALDSATVAITGEGQLDRQSLMGKAPGEVARRSQVAGVPCFVIAGSASVEARKDIGKLGATVVEMGSGTVVGESVGPPGRMGSRRRWFASLRRAADAVCTRVEESWR